MTRRALLTCGWLSSLLYLGATDALVPIAYPDVHSYTSQMVSELFALGAPTRALLLMPMVLYNLLVFGFAGGVWASARGGSAGRLTATALVGYGVCSTVGLLLAPMEPRDAGVSEQTLLHIWATVFQGLFIVLALACGAFLHGATFRRYSLATAAVTVLFGAWAGLQAAGSMRWIGLTERVNIYAWMLWMAVLAVSLLPPVERATAPRGRLFGGPIRQRPVLLYFIATLTISWGGFLVAGGSGFMAGTNWQTDPRFTNAVAAMLAGPPVAGVLLTALVSGRAGLGDLRARLLTWRIDPRWYAVALLTAPIIELGVLLALSRMSPVFLPAIFAAPDKVALVGSGLAVGVAGGLVEELGWTGFAVPRLNARYGVLATGLIVGPVWSIWHFLQMFWVGSTSSGTLPPAIFMPMFFLSAVAILTAYRVLMVWVYERTRSLFAAVCMHASYIVTTLFVLAPPTAGIPFLIYSGVFGAALWAVVAAVGLKNAWHPGRRPVHAGAAASN